MSNFTQYRPTFHLHNPDSIGFTQRTVNVDGFHPMVRQDWGMRDRVRAMVGGYVVRWDTAASENLVAGEQVTGAPSNYTGTTYFVNYGRQLNNLRIDGETVVDIATSQQLRAQLAGSNQSTNIIFEFGTAANLQSLQYIFNAATETPNINGSLGEAVAPLNEIVILRSNNPSRAAWEDDYPSSDSASTYFKRAEHIQLYLGSTTATANLQSPDAMQDTEWVNPVEGGVPYEILLPAYNTPTKVADRIVNTHVDTACRYYGVSADVQMRELSGMTLSVKPIYNFYTSTEPSYENIISTGPKAGLIKEYYLPNIYYLAAELQNTGSELRASYHYDALTLGGSVPWFEALDTGGYTELNIGRYYNLFASALKSTRVIMQDLVTPGNVLLNPLLSEKNKNFLILHGDLEVLKEGRLQTATTPFYNKITIGRDMNLRSGMHSEVNVLDKLMDNPATNTFVDMLQVLIASKLADPANTPAAPPMLKSVKNPIASGIAQGLAFQSPEAVITSYHLSSDMSTVEDPLGSDAYSGGLASTLRELLPGDRGNLQNMINNKDTLNDGFTLIRDYMRSPQEMTVNDNQIMNAFLLLFGAGTIANKTSPDAGLIEAFDLRRRLDYVFANIPCHAETLMYVIKKKLSPAGPPIQTFYISANFSRINAGPLVYCDTQVKYDTEYFYQIDKVLMVFGNKYSYADHRDCFTLLAPGAPANQITNGPLTTFIPVSNVPHVDFYVVPYVNGDLQSRILDKPPVPPILKFHSFKGVNNRLQILLSPSTGHLSSKPVTILPDDEQYFLNEYKSQTENWTITFDEIMDGNKKLTFISDDPVDRYQLFKLDRVPSSYQDFQQEVISIDPVIGIAGDLVDSISPNKKYYYCARAVDAHGNISNPTHIFEIEIVDNKGQIFLTQRIFTYEVEQDKYVKTGRRFLYVEPAFQQRVLQPSKVTAVGPAGPPAGTPGPESTPSPNILGAPNVEDSVWQKTFKVRVTSTQTGRAIDLNLTFKNSGIAKPSE